MVSAYDAERWIAATLESVLGQTSPPDEVIVVDNGSSDATGDVARGFGERVRVVRSSPNRGSLRGATTARSPSSSSDYVAFCPADDVWEPSKLEYQRAIADGRPRHRRRVRRTPATSGWRSATSAARPRPAALDPGELLPSMYAEDWSPAPTTVIRRELFDRLGGFREDLAAEDYEFWIRALLAGAVFFHDPRFSCGCASTAATCRRRPSRCGR